MSPLKKVLFTTLLVAVLLGIAAYLYVAWEPVNPIRFRVVSITPVNRAPHGAAPFELELEIVNTKKVPMRLHAAFLEWSSSSAFGGAPSVRVARELDLPSHGAVSQKFLAPGGFFRADEPFSRIKVHYSTTSTIKHRAMRVHAWLLTHLPKSFSACLPAIASPSYDTDVEYVTPVP